MTIQDEMIGIHPIEGLFNKWIECEDIECTDSKKHRALSEKTDVSQEAIESVAKWLVKYHLSQRKRYSLKKKQEILEKYDFKDFAQSLEVLPKANKTQKGNFGEVILTEYLSQTTGIMVLIFKLQYNPNVDQSMKGDDVLLVDENRIVVGESKFRKTPSKHAVLEASTGMRQKLIMPISLGFIADRLYEEGNFEWSEKIADIQYKLSKSAFDVKNIGFLLSTRAVKIHVERNLDARNKNFLFISLGLDSPIEFMETAFSRAEELILEGNFDGS